VLFLGELLVIGARLELELLEVALDALDLSVQAVQGVGEGLPVGLTQGRRAAGLLAAAPAFATFSSATPAPAGLPALVKMMGPSDWGGIAVGTAIVFGILGRKLAKDIQGWMR
jgi:hypothetical protein